MDSNSLEAASKQDASKYDLILPLLYFLGRVLLFLSLIPNDFYGFGDFPPYF